MKALIIEDNKEIIESVSLVFQFQLPGDTLLSAERGEKGIEMVETESPDIVILDIGLPDIDGFEVLRQIRRFSDVPVVILTGRAIDEVDKIKGLELEADDYIIKPFSPGEFLARLKNALRRANLEQTEETLPVNEESFRNIAEKSADGIVIVDRNGVVRFVNPTGETLFGRKAEELLGKSFSFPVMAGESTEIEIVGKSEAGTGEMRVVETEWEGESVYLATIRDITERKQLEEALRKLDRMKSEFISHVSHELRTPLHSIRGFNKLMLDHKVPDAKTQKEFLTIVDRESEHLGKLIEDLLDVSRIESGRFRIQKQPMSIKNIILDAIESLYSLANEKGITINEEMSATLPEIEVDGERLRQVMVNLLSNAIKFSDDGGSVTVKGKVKDSELQVRVSDHGIGIPEEAMLRLFERFYRVQDSNGVGGAGLGLYISKQIIEAHGGRMWAESKLGEGSTFSFTLPLDHAGGDSHG